MMQLKYGSILLVNMYPYWQEKQEKKTDWKQTLQYEGVLYVLSNALSKPSLSSPFHNFGSLKSESNVVHYYIEQLVTTVTNCHNSSK